jgi:hypothetical protein
MNNDQDNNTNQDDTWDEVFQPEVQDVQNMSPGALNALLENMAELGEIQEDRPPEDDSLSNNNAQNEEPIQYVEPQNPAPQAPTRGNGSGRGNGQVRKTNAKKKQFDRASHKTKSVRRAGDGLHRVTRDNNMRDSVKQAGIITKSSNLRYDDNVDEYVPSRASVQQSIIDEATGKAYMTDANGDIIVDENDVPIGRITESSGPNRYSLYENLEDRMNDATENGETPIATFEDWMYNKITATERNCVSKAMRQCADQKRMKELYKAISSDLDSGMNTAERLNVTDYEIVQLAKLETQRYKSMIGNAMGMIIKVTAPGYKRKTGLTFTVDKATVDRFNQSPMDAKLTPEQKEEKAAIQLKLEEKLQQYADSVERITQWCLDPVNLNFLIKDTDIPNEDIQFWKELREFNGEGTLAPGSNEELQFIREKKMQVMESILRKTFNISANEVNANIGGLGGIAQFDYKQQPGVKKIKALEKESGRLSSKALYEYSYNLANSGETVLKVSPELKNAKATLAKKSHDLFVDRMKSLNHHYKEYFTKRHLQASFGDCISAGIIPPPLTQSTYLVDNDGRSSNMTNMLMWPDRMLWSFYSKGQLVQADINETLKDSIRAFLYSDYLDPTYSAWRSGFTHGGAQYGSRVDYCWANQIALRDSITMDGIDSIPSDGRGFVNYNLMKAKYDSERNFWKLKYQEHIKNMEAPSQVYGVYTKTDNDIHYPTDVLLGEKLTGFQRSSEYTFYTEDWATKTGTDVSTAGSYLTVKENVSPTVTKSGKGCCGSFFSVDLELAPEIAALDSEDVAAQVGKNVWFKDRKCLKKPKGSAKGEREISKWKGKFPKTLEISAICENGHPQVHESSHPEWVALLFKALASFIYNINNENESSEYLCMLRLNKLQLGGNVDESKLIYLLKTYFDFGVCVPEESLQYNQDGSVDVKFYDKLNYQYIMKKRGRQEVWSVVVKENAEITNGEQPNQDELDQLEEEANENNNNPKRRGRKPKKGSQRQDRLTGELENFDIGYDESEIWLVRMMPTLDELWRLFQYAYQNYFTKLYNCSYVRSLYEFMYVDIYSGDIKCGTEAGKKIPINLSAKKIDQRSAKFNWPFNRNGQIDVGFKATNTPWFEHFNSIFGNTVNNQNRVTFEPVGYEPAEYEPENDHNGHIARIGKLGLEKKIWDGLDSSIRIELADAFYNDKLASDYTESLRKVQEYRSSYETNMRELLELTGETYQENATNEYVTDDEVLAWVSPLPMELLYFTQLNGALRKYLAEKLTQNRYEFNNALLQGLKPYQAIKLDAKLNGTEQIYETKGYKYPRNDFQNEVPYDVVISISADDEQDFGFISVEGWNNLTEDDRLTLLHYYMRNDVYGFNTQLLMSGIAGEEGQLNMHIRDLALKISDKLREIGSKIYSQEEFQSTEYIRKFNESFGVDQ